MAMMPAVVTTGPRDCAIAQKRNDTNNINTLKCNKTAVTYLVLVEALAGRTKDGEHHGQKANSGEEPQRSHDGEGLEIHQSQATGQVGVGRKESEVSGGYRPEGVRILR